MEPARRPRLRLSRRRPPAGPGAPSLPPGPPEDREGLWAALLRAAGADPDPDPALPPPPPPPPPGQGPRGCAPRAASPEAFAVGPETFLWTPFPPAPPGPPARPPDAHGTPRAQDQGTQSLRSCPMCQADFAPGVTQLDIDSHLSQCLADSTGDVAW